jgi:hypothetical protein
LKIDGGSLIYRSGTKSIEQHIVVLARINARLLCHDRPGTNLETVITGSTLHRFTGEIFVNTEAAAASWAENLKVHSLARVVEVIEVSSF